MDPIALYPNAETHRRVVSLGVVLVCTAIVLPGGSEVRHGPLFATVVLEVGLAVLWAAARAGYPRRPSFAGDASGFTLLGRPKLGWDGFNWAEVHRLGWGPVTAIEWLVVSSSHKGSDRKTYIWPLRMNGPAPEMAAEINAYAKYAQRAEDLTRAFAGLPDRHRNLAVI